MKKTLIIGLILLRVLNVSGQLGKTDPEHFVSYDFLETPYDHFNVMIIYNDSLLVDPIRNLRFVNKQNDTLRLVFPDCIYAPGDLAIKHDYVGRFVYDNVKIQFQLKLPIQQNTRQQKLLSINTPFIDFYRLYDAYLIIEIKTYEINGNRIRYFKEPEIRLITP